MRRHTPRPLGIVHWIADLDAFGDGTAVLAAARPLFDEGLPSLQLRGKGRSAEELIRSGEPLREAAARAACLFVVNGSVRAAVALGADGLHLPAAGRSLRTVRAALPAITGAGRSCHDAGEVAAAGGADWILLSPVHATRSKPAARPLGLHGFAALAGGAPAPVYALGGITEASFAACLDAGAAGVAAIRGLQGESGIRLLRATNRWLAGEG
ncbi:MAG: thiamine phosphate synthase [Candidatus Eiseniibacteriota bacterium]